MSTIAHRNFFEDSKRVEEFRRQILLTLLSEHLEKIGDMDALMRRVDAALRAYQEKPDWRTVG